MNELWIYLALAIWLISITLALEVGIRRHKNGKIFKTSNILFAGTFLAGFFMFIPMYEEMFTAGSATERLWKTITISFHNTIRLFIVDCDFEGIVDAAEGLGPASEAVFTCLAAGLYLCAPILTFGFVLSFFKNVYAFRRYLGAYFKDMYIFSEMNERSIALAESIAEAEKTAVVVFTDVYENDEEFDNDLETRARECGAICFKKDITEIHFGVHSKKKEISFLIIGDDGDAEFIHTASLMKKYGDRENTSLYIFSENIETELVLPSLSGSRIKVRRINGDRSMIYRLLYQEGHKIFEEARPDGEGKKISALIVGLGRYGTTMLRTLSWFCQLDGYKVDLTAFDKESNAASKFEALCPELMDPEYNGVTVPGESEYKIRILNDLDTETIEFHRAVKQCTEATYVFVALGSDELNIKTSVKLRMLFEQMKIHPRIQTIVYNSDKCEALKNIENFQHQPYDIEFLGDLRSVYSKNVILNSELERQALQSHLNWGDERDFWCYEYNYNSSMATALHQHIRIKCGVPGAGKSDAEMTKEETENIMIVEHRRWNAYMRSEGYIYSGSKEKSSRNDLGKMHHNLVKYSDLSREVQEKDHKVGMAIKEE